MANSSDIEVIKIKRSTK